MIFFLYAVHIFHNSIVAVVAYTLVVSDVVNKYTSVVVVFVTNKYVAAVDCIDAAVVADENSFVLDAVEVVVGAQHVVLMWR